MSKLNVTPGEWRQDEIGVYATGIEDNVVCKSPGVSWESYKRWKDNAQLIADAGTTYNKCGLLPSELMQQNEELKEILKSIVSDEKEDILRFRSYLNKARELLTKHSKQ